MLQYALYKRLQRVLRRQCSYTAHATKRRAGLYRGVSCDCSHSAANDTRPIQSTITPPAPRWSVSQYRSTSSTYQIPPSRRTLYRSSQPPYYNKVYKGAECSPCYSSMPDSAAYRRPCQPGGVSSHRLRIAGKCCALRTRRCVSVSTCTRSARRRSRCFPRPAACSLAPGQQSGRAFWHPPPGGAVQQERRNGRRGTIDGSRRSSFSGFRPIANRGQQ